MSKTLVLITSAFPFGRGEQFLEGEVDLLANQFDRIVVVPQKKTGEVRALPKNFFVEESFARLVSRDGVLKRVVLAIFYLVINKKFVPIKAAEIRSHLAASYYAFRAGQYFRRFCHPVSSKGNEIVFYSYWFSPVVPTDFFLRLVPASGAQPARGEFMANQLDLEVLSRLAGRLPFDGGLRKRLATLAPAGRVAPMDLKWSLKGDTLATYAVNARFEGLGIEPLGAWPGFAGMAGRIEGNEKGGRFTLSGRDAGLELPQVFPESHLQLSELAAEGSWSHPEGALEVTLASSSFANEDARGTASGRYRATPDTPGRIDLQARLSEADGTAVWRYIPHVV